MTMRRSLVRICLISAVNKLDSVHYFLKRPSCQQAAETADRPRSACKGREMESGMWGETGAYTTPYSSTNEILFDDLFSLW